MELDEDEKAVLDQKLRLIGDHLPERPEATITYFAPDAKKAGGSYKETSGRVKKIDTVESVVVMTDDGRIPIDDIYEIECNFTQDAQ